MSGVLFVGRAFSLLLAHSGRLLVALIMGVAAVGSYEIVIRIPRFLRSVLGFVNAAVMPAASELAARQRRGSVQRLFLVGTHLHILASYPIVTGAMLFAEPLMSVWMGAEYVGLGVFLRLALLHNLLVALIGIGGSIVVGTNHHLRRFTAIGVGNATISVLLTILLMTRMGLVGAFLGSAGGLAVMLPFYYGVLSKVADVSGRQIGFLVGRIALIGLVPMAVTLVVGQFVVADTVVKLILVFSIWCGVFWWGCYRWAIRADERVVLGTLASLLRVTRSET
jgi:O-antigen/teichoic acid export membrane protein